MERNQKQLPDSVTHYAQLKNNDFIGHWDIPEGKTLKVTITDVLLEELRNPATNRKEWKTTMGMKGATKRMVLNSTNMALIAGWHGSNPKKWPGKDIELVRAITNLKGEQVECIRVVGNKKKKVQDQSAAAQAAAE